MLTALTSGICSAGDTEASLWNKNRRYLPSWKHAALGSAARSKYCMYF